MLSFTIFKIPVVVQPWFWITLGLIGLMSTGVQTPQELTLLALFVLAGFISILVHELGHALTGKAFGAPTQITLMAFGGFAAFPVNAFNRKQDFMVTAAGPLVQALLGLIFLMVLMFLPEPPPLFKAFLYYLTVISIFWAVINLVPVYPLDGGRLVSAICGPSRKVLAIKISMVSAAVLAVLGLVFKIGILFPIFLGFMAYQNWKDLQQYRR